MILEMSELTDDILMILIEITIRSNTALNRAIRKFIDTGVPDMIDLMQNVCYRITASVGSKSEVYSHMNPN